MGDYSPTFKWSEGLMPRKGKTRKMKLFRRLIAAWRGFWREAQLCAESVNWEGQHPQLAF